MDYNDAAVTLLREMFDRAKQTGYDSGWKEGWNAGYTSGYVQGVQEVIKAAEQALGPESVDVPATAHEAMATDAITTVEPAVFFDPVQTDLPPYKAIVMDYVSRHPGCTARQAQKELGIGSTTPFYKLAAEGMLRREGPRFFAAHKWA